MPDVFAVADLLVDLVRRQAADDVALIVYYGSHATGTAGPRSDLDLYYIPDDGKGEALYRSIIFQECPFEFWGISWEFAGRIASGRHRWAVAPSIIANAKILHARSPEDEARFATLQATIARLQQPESRPEMIRLAQEVFDSVAAPLYRIMTAAVSQDRASAQWAVVQVIDAVLDCLALMNQTFLVKNWASDLSQIERLAIRPAHLGERIQALLLESNLAKVRDQAERLAAETRTLLLTETRACPIPGGPDTFVGYYPAIKEYVNKILSACERRDWVNASVVAAQMQRELAVMLASTEDRLSCSDTCLLGEFRAASDRLGFPDLWDAVAARDIDQLAHLTRQFESQVQALLTERGIALNSAETLEDLRALIG